MQMMTPVFNRTVLESGVRIVSEKHQHPSAFSVGFWFEKGTRHEPLALNGVCHFLEHLTFKGTALRDYYKIAYDIESVGGELNAFTSKEHTCFHALVLHEDWKVALDVLSDISFQMVAKQSDFDLEKKIVLQEIDLTDEQYEEQIYDLFFLNSLGNSPLGWPILGTKESVSNLQLSDVIEFYHENYHPRNLVVSVAGNCNHDEVVAEVVRLLDSRVSSARASQKAQTALTSAETLRWTPKKIFKDSRAEQHHLLMGVPAPSFQDPMRFDAVVLNSLIGGGMTSLLFQEIREKSGLSYSISSQLSSFVDFGCLTIYAGTQEESVKQCLDLILKVINDLKATGVTAEQLQLYKQQIVGSLSLGAEDVENRMQSLAINEMIFKEYRPVSAVIDEVKAVSLMGINALLASSFAEDKWSYVLLGESLPANVSGFEVVADEATD